MPLVNVQNTFLPNAPSPPSLIHPSPARPSETQAPHNDNKKFVGNAAIEEKPKVKPSTYNGSTPSEDYLAQFELVAEINKWSMASKATYLAVSLTGSAQAVLGDLAPEARRDFSELTSALAARFGTENQQEVFRSALKNRSRLKDEKLPELAQAIRRLTRQAYPEAPQPLRETLARDYFVDALVDADMRWRIHQSRPKTLNDALTVAVELEAFLETGHPRKQVHAVAVEESPDQGASAASDLKDIKSLLQKLLDKPRPYGQYTGCHTCGDKGHFQRDCPKRRNQESPKLPGNEKQPVPRG
ncbi:uncharacterized protein LOC114574680 [Exaiptasia diaphana]|uniref:CCHC-type domain-containing protein n=1 Tax=Exaiptasia diaphana TaxID=2652724 RepID=A0A913YGZ3_EXADI|nr:uncharacterized protein LOC114574680 [Exaiptasia diaphana]XP_028513772.1 uncharacterized protein LOC114574680 [Exaiptasia diaphana]